MTYKILEVSLDQSADTTYTVTLGDDRYDLRVKYLYRLTNVAYGTSVSADEFVIYIGASGDDPVMQASLKTNRDILEPYHYMDNVPSGQLMLRDTLADKAYQDNQDYSPERASWDDWGSRFKLLYVYDEDD